MSNQKRLKEYLIGENGYLKSDISNGKVIMLSGKWGSGKTHFWKNELENNLIEFQSKEQKAYVYSSLYGNTSLEKIEDNIYAQAYLCSIGGENVVSKGYKKAKDFGKRFGGFCSLIDVSKLVDGIDEIQQNNIKNSALLYLKDGGLICFDDFERKSKDVDLNDLFGFISHLAIDLDCKVVIILNDDVFDGIEKDVFSRVKEKTVSKFLKYEPSISDLFDSIFDSDKKYSILAEHKELIVKTIEETKELNARIYIQVLDNLVEWIDKKQEINDDIMRYLIFININFVLFHTILNRKTENLNAEPYNLHIIKKLSDEGFDYFINNIIGFGTLNEADSFDEYWIKLKEKIINNKDISDERMRTQKQFIKDNLILFKSDYFANKLKISDNVNDETFKKINNFIETGILTDE
ncbi:MAG: hypothetical protein WA916_06420 [Arcobacter sp.]|uniref:hypothetical protein n=1 Tax=Arcobacter sp. TaxID=1872629 RepID=UPI003C75959E